MNRSLLIVSLLSLSTAAYADKEADRQHGFEVNEAGSAFDTYGEYVAEMQRAGTMVDAEYTTDDPSHCTDLLAKYGDIGPDELVRGMHFDKLPGAVNSSGNEYDVPFKEMKQLCQQYRDLRAVLVATKGLDADWQATVGVEDHFDVAERIKEVGLRGDPGDGPADAGARCVADVDQAIAGGAPRDTKVNFHESEQLTLGELRARCQHLTTWWPAQKDAVRAEQARQIAEIEAVYKKVGIKGDRLALFASYGTPDGAGFYLPGCERVADTAAAMKKAKKLFVWLEGSDGYTVRKYSFKGDKFTVSEKSFDLQKDAYRWCH